MSGGDLSGIERGSLGSRGSLPSCSTNTRMPGGGGGGAMGTGTGGGATWPHHTASAPLSQLWLGRQVHATRLLVWSQLVLAAAAAVLLLAVATDSIDPVRLNAAMALTTSPREEQTDVHDYEDSSIVNDSTGSTAAGNPSEVGPLSRFARPQTVAEQLAEKRNWATGIAVLAYFYVISIFLAWWGVQASETQGRREEARDGDCRSSAGARDGSRFGRWLARLGSASCLRRATTTVLLVPWLLSVISLLLPLLILSIRLLGQSCAYLTMSERAGGWGYYGHELWFKYFPLAGVWAIALYFVAGCCGAFVFAWRRADGRYGGTAYGTYPGLRRGGPPGRFASGGVPLRESAAAASFSWTFRSTKDRYRITNKDGDLNKSTYSMASNRSYKSTRNPTLRGYTRKTEDMDVSLLSEENYAAGDSLDRNYNNNCAGGLNSVSGSAHAPAAGPYVCTLTTITSPSRRMNSSERGSRGYAAYSGPGTSRAPLEPVEEEEYTPTPEKTAENGDLRM